MKYVLSDKAVRALTPLVRGVARSSGVGHGPAAVSNDAFPAPFTVRWSQSENGGEGAWVMWIPDDENLVSVAGEYVAIDNITAAQVLPEGWYALDSVESDSTEIWLNVHVPGSGTATAEIDAEKATEETGEHVTSLLIAQIETDEETGKKTIKQFIDSAVVVCKDEDTKVTPDNISTEYIPPDPPPEEGEEEGANAAGGEPEEEDDDEPPKGKEGELQIKGFKVGEPVSAYSLAQDLLDSMHGEDYVLVRTAQGVLEYKQIANAAHSISVNGVQVQGVIVCANQDIALQVATGAQLTTDVIPPADDDGDGAVGNSTNAAHANHKHPYGPNYVRNNAGINPDDCNKIQAGNAIAFLDGDGYSMKILGTRLNPMHAIQLTPSGSGSITVIALRNEALEYGGGAPSSGRLLKLGAGEVVPVVVNDVLYIGDVSATNTKRTRFSRGEIVFFPTAASSTGGDIVFHYNGSSGATGYVSDSGDGIEIYSATVGAHNGGIKINAPDNKAKLDKTPTISLANSTTHADNKAIVDVAYLGNNLHTLSINGTPTGIKVISTDDINIVIPSGPTGSISYVGSVRYNPASNKHCLEQRIDTYNLATGVNTQGEWAMIENGKAVEESF